MNGTNVEQVVAGKFGNGEMFNFAQLQQSFFDGRRLVVKKQVIADEVARMTKSGLLKVVGMGRFRFQGAPKLRIEPVVDVAPEPAAAMDLEAKRDAVLERSVAPMLPDAPVEMGELGVPVVLDPEAVKEPKPFVPAPPVLKTMDERVRELAGHLAVKGVAHVDRNRALNRRNGSTDRDSADWPSKVLHDVGPRMEFGIDRRRLAALADFVEALERIAPISRPRGTPWTDGPVAPAKFVVGQVPVKGFMLQEEGHAGMGLVEFNGQGEAEGYWLTGFGLVCWGWGAEKGMANVAEPTRCHELTRLFTAQPVRKGLVAGYAWTQITTKDVAAAIREYLESGDVVGAWRTVGRRHVPEPKAKVAPVAAKPVREPSRVEAWKAAVVDEEYDTAEGIALAALEGIEEKLALLAEQKAAWSKRLEVVGAMAL